MVAWRSRAITAGENARLRSPAPRMCPCSRIIGNDGKPTREYSAACGPPIFTSVIRNGHVPVFEIGKGSSERHGPKLEMTVGGNAMSGGTSIAAQGELAVTIRVITGVSGSSVMISSLHCLRPHEVGVKRITKSTQESWLTIAGNGLLTSLKSGQAGKNKTLLTSKLHLPTLQMEMVFSAVGPPAHTSPKSVEPVTRTSPAGVWPLTETNRLGTLGSLQVSVIVPGCAPRVVGCKRMGMLTESPW